MTSIDPKVKIANIAIAFSLMMMAAFIRTPGLGKWCLTEDEYYSSQPVAFILEKGVPQFPGGGYYARGLALQYLTVIPAMVFKKWEFAVRVVPLLFGVLTVSMLFILANRFLDTFPATLCATMLLLSSWHIEFSRFARFYAPFQFLFLLFIYSLYEGYGKGRRGYSIFAFVLGLLSVFIDSYSIFLPLILLSMIFLLDKVEGKTALSIFLQAGTLLAINLIFNSANLEMMGVVNPLPPEMALDNTSSSSATSAIIFPNFGLLRSIEGSTIAIVGFLILLGAAGYLLRKSIRYCGKYWDVIVLILSLLLPLLHQYALLVLLSTILLINKRSAWRIFKESAPIWGIYWIGTVAYWVAIASSTGNFGKILHFMVGFPPIKYAIFIPFKEHVPLLGGFLLFVVILSSCHHLIQEQSWKHRFLISLVLLLLLAMPVFYTSQKTTRYVFFFFPLILLLSYTETVSLIDLTQESFRLRMKRSVTTAILLIPIVSYAATEDFQWRHVSDVSSAQMNFRLGEYDRFFHHWYLRVDFETPSQYVSKVFRKGDAVVADHIVMTRYLDVPYMFYVYYKQTHTYKYFARREGTEEKWTGRPLLSRPEELAALVPTDPDRSLWLITSLVERHAGTSFMYKHHNVKTITEQYKLDADLVFKGLDERTGVWKITRSN